ncbi:MAG: hypothetical protein LAO23_05250 [Acidobacteriia bacterium]|nr:hypothetical protein [Terriglobia bacterium]
MSTTPLQPTTVTLETSCKIARSEKPTITLADLEKVTPDQIVAMSFRELDGFIDDGVQCIALNRASIIRARQAVRPAFIRIHAMLTEKSQGVRNDLNDVPVMTWTMFCHNKYLLGCKRTLDALIKDAGLENPSKQAKFLKGDKAILLANGTDRPVSYTGEVTHVHEKTNPNDYRKVEIAYQTPDGVKKDTVPVTAVEKIKITKKHLAIGDLVILDDIEGGAEVRYDGNKKLTRTDTLSKAEAAKLAQDERNVASAKKKREAAVAKKAKAMEDKRLIAAAKKEAAALQAKKKANGKRGHKAATKPTRPFIAQKLGDKFFVFEKGEVEISIRTAKSSQFDTLADAVVCANGLNQKYGFEATI